MTNRVTFDYAFSAPHTLTLARPSAGEKILTRTSTAGVEFYRTFDSQRSNDPLAWRIYPMDVESILTFACEGIAIPLSRWYRHPDGIPCLMAEASYEGVDIALSAISAVSGVVTRITYTNTTPTTKDMQAHLAMTNGWVINNRGWIDGVNSNLLLTMNGGRADRVVALGLGADAYPFVGHTEENSSERPPMTDQPSASTAAAVKRITSACRIAPGTSRTCYFVLPHKAYFADLSALKVMDPEAEFTAAVSEWNRLLARAAALELPDEGMIHAYRSCLADIFVMRERVGNRHMGIGNGTNFYRSVNSGEPLEAEMLLDTLGYTREATRDYPLYLEGQDNDGCWATVRGWEHEMWGVIYNKAHAVLHHYELTQDRAFLESNYPRMLASTRFSHAGRQATRNAADEGKLPMAARGLMPRGMGDCGMQNGGDYYGFFYPHNCQAVAADALTLKAARILGRAEDIPFLTEVYDTARADLLSSLRANARKEDGYIRIPAVADAPDTSSYGCLYAHFPCELMDADDPLIQGTMQHIESRKKSVGGLPKGTGWLKDGLWVAMALHNFARAYLRMGLYAEARAYLYPAVNHASPLVTWCEERGEEPGSTAKTGDEQHLWTPLSVCQYLVDMLLWENDREIHLMSGICPEWLDRGTVGVRGLCTSLGKVSLSLTRRTDGYTLTWAAQRTSDKQIILHLPDGRTAELPMSKRIRRTFPL
jgi:hypothetical protein